MEIILRISGSMFNVFWMAWELFSDFLGLVNKLENKTIFMKNRISSLGSGEADRGGIWAF